jgi:hypothetical protein
LRTRLRRGAWRTKIAAAIAVEDYVALWRDRIPAGEGAVPSERWDAYWEELLALRVAATSDRAQVDRHVTDMNRESASPRPGLWIGRNRPLEEAEALDDTGALVSTLRDAIEVIRDALDARVD